MTKHTTGPRGGKTTVTPSGLQKTSAYLRPDQMRALQRGKRTASGLLRRAVDRYFGLDGKACSLTKRQRDAATVILRDRFGMEDRKVDEFLTLLAQGGSSDDV